MNVNIHDDKLIIKHKSDVYFIPLEKIIYIESFNKLTYVSLIEKEFVVRISLKSLEEILPDYFKRAHRSFIINVDQIRELKMISTNIYEAYFSEDKLALVTKEVVNNIISNKMDKPML